MSRFYDTDPDDPYAPVELDEYHGLRPGMRVRYVGLHGHVGEPWTITELIGWPDADLPPKVVAICDDGTWEVDADNLVPMEAHDVPDVTGGV